MNTRSFLVGVVLAFVAVATYAAGPNLMSYQGQVLTSGGAPIANGSYPASFVFFSVPSGGLPLWSEPTTIATSAGLFSHTLGSVTPIPSNMFTANPDIWLEVTVNGQVQSPRTQLLSAGNAMAVSTVDKATGGILKSGIGVGEPMVNDGYIYLHSKYSPSPTAALFDYGGHGSAFGMYQQNGTTYAYTWPSTIGAYGGNFYLQNGYGGIGFAVEGDYGSGSPFVSMSGLSYASFDLGTTGNASINLPNDAISAPEILDEPGVASNFADAGFDLTASGMQDLVTVTITIPAPGYIWLTGKITQVYSCGGTNHFVFAQIDDIPGGSWEFGWMTFLSNTTAPCVNESMHCQRMFFKSSAGSYTFRLEAMHEDLAGGGGTASVSTPTLTAMYFPTSYGSVVTFVSSAEAGAFESAKAANSSAATLTHGVGATDVNSAGSYVVDLRELELKVAKTEADAQKARAALAEARLKEQMDPLKKTAGEKK